MRSISAKYAGLSLLGLVLAFSTGATEAQAQNLFDLLFGSGNRMTRPHLQRQPEPQPEQPAQRRAVAPKISSPSYYDYKPEPLVKIELSALEEEGGEGDVGADAATAEPAGDPAFRKAQAELVNLDLVAEKQIAAAIAEHYAANPEFVWVSDGKPNARAGEALRVLSEAASHGLSEADYAVAVPSAAGSSAAERRQEMIRFEMAMSARVLRYIRDSHAGRVDPNKLSGYHDFAPKPLDLAVVLDAVAHSEDVGAYMEVRHPRNEKYRALRVELEALRASAENEIVVDPETFVRPGRTHPEFAKLLQIIERDADEAFKTEHGEMLAAHAGSDLYADELVPLIKATQKVHNLNPDGIVGPRTVAAIAGDSKAARIDKVLLALERLRWHPSWLGDPRVMINAAGFTATFTQDGRDRLSMRAVVGKTANQTSFFHDEVEYVEFNPYWGVPRSILINEMLPRLVRDPGYLDRAGYEVTNSRGQRVSSASINWAAHGANIPYDVRQLPSERNALGELKIMFPNKHAIYMHDTPAKNLFERDTRAYSHGCVRLQDPRGMAAAVLGWSVDEVASRVAQGHSRQDAPAKIPVYVGYFTAWPDDAGAVSYHGDIYGRDDRMEKALGKIGDLRAASS